MVLELPGWCPIGKARGLGDLVGDAGKGEGEGVRARGERGICPTDFLLLGTVAEQDGPDVCRAFGQPVECNLCFKPCKVEGRW